MKKATLLLIVAIASFASCSKSDDNKPSNNNNNNSTTTNEQLVGTWLVSPDINTIDFYNSAGGKVLNSETDTNGISEKLIFNAGGTFSNVNKDDANDPADSTGGTFALGNDTTFYNSIPATKLSMVQDSTAVFWVKVQGTKLYLYYINPPVDVNGTAVRAFITKVFDKQ